MSELPTYVPLGTMAEKLSLAEITLRNWLREGKIPKHTYIKVGNTYRFNFEAIEKELLACTQEQTFEDTLKDPSLDAELEAEDLNLDAELEAEDLDLDAELEVAEHNPFVLDDTNDYQEEY